MIATTLNRIRAHYPCSEGWSKLLNHLGKTKGDNETLPFSVILESNGIDDAIWCCAAEPKYKREWRLFAVWCARKVQHLMDDHRSIIALDVAENHANGLASNEELAAAMDAARAAALAAARDASGAAAAKAASWAAAGAAALAASWAAAGAASWAARDAARAASWAARAAARAASLAAARDAALAAARDAQKIEFLRIITETEERE